MKTIIKRLDALTMLDQPLLFGRPYRIWHISWPGSKSGTSDCYVLELRSESEQQQHTFLLPGNQEIEVLEP